MEYNEVVNHVISDCQLVVGILCPEGMHYSMLNTFKRDISNAVINVFEPKYNKKFEETVIYYRKFFPSEQLIFLYDHKFEHDYTEYVLYG